MMIPVKYVDWDPPHLTEEEELKLGRRIAATSPEQFKREFRESITSPLKRGRPEVKKRLGILYGVLLGVLLLLMLIGKTQLVVQYLLLCALTLSIYFGTAFFAVRRFNKWVDRLIAKYAAHVAKGGR